MWLRIKQGKRPPQLLSKLHLSGELRVLHSGVDRRFASCMMNLIP
jgi:hypothetical protein